MSWLTLLLCWLLRPQAVAVIPGWYVNGVAPSGAYELRPWLGRPEMDLEDAHARRAIADDRRVVGRVWCLSPATPRQDGQRVWCARPAAVRSGS